VITLIATNTDVLYAGYDELNKVAKALAVNIQVVSNVKSRLAEIAGMDFQQPLQKVIDDTGHQMDFCRMLCCSLDTICQSYISCEQRIFDRCEDSIIYYEQPPARFVDLASTMGLLHELSFHKEGGA